MLNTDKFIIGESDATPLYRMSQQLDMIGERERARIEKQRQESVGVGKYYDAALSDKENLSGTPLDPNIRSMLIDARGVVAAMNKKNAGFENIQAALAPMIAKINNYQQKAQQYSAYKDQYLKSVEKFKGADATLLAPKIDREMFFNEDGTLKDIEKIDINKFDEVASGTILKYGDEVTNNKGFEEFANQFKATGYNASVDEIDEKGARKKKVYNVKAPEWTTVDQQGKIVPRYTEAYTKDENGDGIPDTFNFSKDPAVKDKHAIRLLDEVTFDHLVESNPFIHARIAAKLKKSGFTGDPRTDIRAKNAARAMAYDELKAFSWGEKTEQTINKEAPAPKVNVTVKTGKDDDVNTVDLWPEFSDNAKTGKPFTSTQAGIVRSIGNNFTGASEGANAYGVREDANGNIEVFTKTDITQEKDAAGRPSKKIAAGTSLGTVDPVQFNAMGNQIFGIKAKAKQLKKDQAKRLTWDEWKKANPKGTFLEFNKTR